MSIMSKRVARLEGPASEHFMPIAVASAPLPLVVTEEWAATLLALYGWSGRLLYVTVSDGPAGLTLKPMPLPPMGSDAGKAWLDASRYPHATILSGVHGLRAKRHENIDDFRQWLGELEKEVA